ncbi:MAG: oxygenase MpaB family protein [Pseudomonadota bacterium]
MPLSQYAEDELDKFLYAGLNNASPALFLEPAGEPGLVDHHGIVAKVYSVPLSVFIGGMTAVILELAEPRVRAGVWGHSIFKTDPVLRLRRTGLAAMVTVYAPASVARETIAQVHRRHAKVHGQTPEGLSYSALDPELLSWVHATATYGFIASYDRYAQPLSPIQWDEAMGELCPVAEAYGVKDPPLSQAQLREVLEAMIPRLGPSAALTEFLDIMRRAPVLPPGGRWLQPLLVRAAVELVPETIRKNLGLERQGLHPVGRHALRLMIGASRMIPLRNHPAELARQRLGLVA